MADAMPLWKILVPVGANLRDVKSLFHLKPTIAVLVLNRFLGPEIWLRKVAVQLTSVVAVLCSTQTLPYMLSRLPTEPSAVRTDPCTPKQRPKSYLQVM